MTKSLAEESACCLGGNVREETHRETKMRAIEVNALALLNDNPHTHTQKKGLKLRDVLGSILLCLFA